MCSPSATPRLTLGLVCACQIHCLTPLGTKNWKGGPEWGASSLDFFDHIVSLQGSSVRSLGATNKPPTQHSSREQDASLCFMQRLFFYSSPPGAILIKLICVFLFFLKTKTAFFKDFIHFFIEVWLIYKLCLFPLYSQVIRLCFYICSF